MPTDSLRAIILTAETCVIDSSQAHAFAKTIEIASSATLTVYDTEFDEVQRGTRRSNSPVGVNP